MKMREFLQKKLRFYGRVYAGLCGISVELNFK
jgi:hypothetical protein